MTLDYKKDGKIAIFTINRPEVMNALDSRTYREIREALLDFRDDPDLWVGIMTGAGDKAFSAGADLKPENNSDNGDDNHAEATQDWDSLAGGFNIWKPLIAAINGYCLGGGLEIALLCDIKIASENASLGLPEVTRGLMADGGGIQRIARELSRCHAAEILLTGKQISAQDAYRMGLVNQVVPLDKLMPTAMEWAETILQAAPLSVRATKEGMMRGVELPFMDGVKLDRSLAAALYKSEDFSEGIRAFNEKRKPDYKGK